MQYSMSGDQQFAAKRIQSQSKPTVKSINKHAQKRSTANEQTLLNYYTGKLALHASVLDRY